MLREYDICECKIAPHTSGPCGVMVFINPDPQEKKYIVEELKVDEHTLNSALDPDELSRLEYEPEHVALIVKRPKSVTTEKDQLVFKVSSAGIFLFKERLIVVISEDVPLFEGKQFGKVVSLPELMLKIINRFIVHFLEHLKVINIISDELEQKVNASMENKFLINMFTLEKSLVYYLNAINSNSVLLDKLKLSKAKIGFNEIEAEFLDDISVENTQCYRQAEIYSNILASLMDARVSIVSNNLNILMKTLNIITIGIMVPTLVVSAFSMNVMIPFQKSPGAFWIIMGMAAVSVITMMALWKFKKW